MAKPIYLHYSLADEAFFDPELGSLRGAFALIRNDAYTLRCQAVLNRGASISGSTLQAANRTVDLSAYSGVPTFALKTETLFAADGDYSQAWTGFATDSSWHSLANGRFSLSIAPTITPATYVAEIALADGSGQAFSLHGAGTAEGRTRCVLCRDVAIGGETTAASGTSVVSGTAVITAGQTSKAVTLAGVTAGSAIIVSLLNVSELTTVSVAPGAGQFTITIGSTYDTDVTVAYYVLAVATLNGIAVVPAGENEVVVTYGGVSASSVILASLLNVTQLTTVSVTVGTGQFTVKLGAVYATDVSVAYTISEL